MTKTQVLRLGVLSTNPVLDIFRWIVTVIGALFKVYIAYRSLIGALYTLNLTLTEESFLREDPSGSGRLDQASSSLEQPCFFGEGSDTKPLNP